MDDDLRRKAAGECSGGRLGGCGCCSEVVAQVGHAWARHGDGGGAVGSSLRWEERSGEGGSCGARGGLLAEMEQPGGRAAYAASEEGGAWSWCKGEERGNRGVTR